MSIEKVDACPVCGNRSFTTLFSTKDYTATGDVFTLAQCNRCELIITNPRPSSESIGKYYDSENYISHTGGNASLLDIAYRTVRKISLQFKRRLISKSKPGTGTIIDYGCGTGEFLEACQQAGWKTIGIEPSLKAREKISPSIESHESLSQTEAKADVITLWHVLEHVHHPDKTLQHLRDHLKEDGTIFVAVPNSTSYDAQHYREYWAGYDVPRHLWHFNKNNMKLLLEANGFRLSEIVPLKFDSFYVSLLSEQYKTNKKESLRNVLRSFSVGLKSNRMAGKDNFSSLIYIAQR